MRGDDLQARVQPVAVLNVALAPVALHAVGGGAALDQSPMVPEEEGLPDENEERYDR